MNKSVGESIKCLEYILQEVLVIYEFEMMAKAIQQTRPDFTYIHGGIVNSHDIIGQRLGEDTFSDLIFKFHAFSL